VRKACAESVGAMSRTDLVVFGNVRAGVSQLAARLRVSPIAVYVTECHSDGRQYDGEKAGQDDVLDFAA